MYTLVTIDPGYGGTGVAYFPRVTYKKLRPPKGCWTFKARKGKHTNLDLQLVDNVMMKLRFLWPVPTQVAIEFPQFWATSPVSRAAATKGGLFQLSALCGALAWGIYTTFAINAVFIYPCDWKGQLPKHVVEKRILRTWPSSRFIMKTEHEIDAVGLGLYMQKGPV